MKNGVRKVGYTKEPGISPNKLFDEMATVALAQFDAKTRLHTSLQVHA
jgi:hypothetical protein